MCLTYLHAVIPLTSRKLYFCRIDYTLACTPKESEEEKAAVAIYRYTPTFRVEGPNKTNNFVIRIEYEWFSKCGPQNHKALVPFCFHTTLREKINCIEYF
jgi:hypothetical protein